MAGPPPKKWKGTEEKEDLNDSFDEDDEILDGPSQRYFVSQHPSRVAPVSQASKPTVYPVKSIPLAASSTVSQSTSSIPARTTVTPGQTGVKLIPPVSRMRPTAPSRSCANTPTSSHGSQNTVSQGEFIAIKFQLGNAQREKDALKSQLSKLSEQFNTEKKKLEGDKQKEIRKYQEKLKMAEGEVNSLRMSSASMRAETSMMDGDLDESMRSVSSIGSSQRANTARQTHSLPRFSGGNGFTYDIAATFTHNQTVRIDGDVSFQDIPSQAFDTPTPHDTAPILDGLPSPPIQRTVETDDEKIQTDIDNENGLDVPPFSHYIHSSMTTVANCCQPDNELYSLLEKIVRDPSEPAVLEIGEPPCSPLNSQEIPALIPHIPA